MKILELERKTKTYFLKATFGIERTNPKLLGHRESHDTFSHRKHRKISRDCSDDPILEEA